MTFATSEDSPSLIRGLAVRSVGRQCPSASSCGQSRLWSDLADAQADLSLRWAHRLFCWFCRALVHKSFCRLCHVPSRLIDLSINYNTLLFLSLHFFVCWFDQQTFHMDFCGSPVICTTVFFLSTNSTVGFWSKKWLKRLCLQCTCVQTTLNFF